MGNPLELREEAPNASVDSPVRKGLLQFDSAEARVADEEALTAIQQPQFVEYLNDLYLNMQSSGKSG